MNRIAQGFVLFVAMFVTGYAGGLVACSQPPTRAQVAKTATDLCAARSAERLLEAASGGVLVPAAGSVRARVESAEDEFCASISDAGG